MNPSTQKPATDRAVLCQRAGELADFAPLLAELGMQVEIHEGELPTPDALAGVRLVIVAGQRLADGRAVPVRRWPRTLAVVDDGSKTLAAHLNRLGVAMVVRRPIHLRTLRLLILHQLYRGPERRVKQRIPIGKPIRVGAGLFKANATLLELSRSGARIALPSAPKVGSLIQLVFGKELTNAKPINLQAKVVRSIRTVGSSSSSGESEIGVALLDAAALARPIQAILDRFATGPASSGASARPAPDSSARQVTTSTAAARPVAQPTAPVLAIAPAAPIPRALPTAKPAPTPTPTTPAKPTTMAKTATRTAPVPPVPSTTSRAKLPPESIEPRRLPPSFQHSSPSPAPALATLPTTTSAAAATLAPSTVSTISTLPTIPKPAPASHEPDPLDFDLEGDFDGTLDEDFELELVDALPFGFDAHNTTDADTPEAADDHDAPTDPEIATGERRRSERVAYDQRVVALDAQAARVVVGCDLGFGGMRIAANPALAVGDVLRIALHAGTETEPLVVLAGVERDDGADGLALAFADLTSGQRDRLEKIMAASGGIHGHVDDDDTIGSGGDSLVVGELLGRVARGRAIGARGFTLVELMLVVAIIGIMSSVAIPLFGRYQLRAKSSEVKTNLGAIRVVQEAHFAEYSRYVPANAEPPLIPGPQPTDFDVAGTDYAAVGWSPEGRVYFSYAVTTSADEAGFTTDAAADIDGNGILQIWGYAKPDPLGTLTPGGLGCDPSLLEPELIGSCTAGSPAF